MSDDKQNPCEGCYHSAVFTDAQSKEVRECRRFPPQCFMFSVPSKLVGSKEKIIKRTAFPNCIALCGFFQHIDLKN